MAVALGGRHPPWLCPSRCRPRGRARWTRCLNAKVRLCFQEACVRLPEHFRAAFFLWAQEDLTFVEIAQALGVTESTARWRVFKARLLLLDALHHYFERQGP